MIEDIIDQEFFDNIPLNRHQEIVAKISAIILPRFKAGIKDELFTDFWIIFKNRDIDSESKYQMMCVHYQKCIKQIRKEKLDQIL